MPSAYHFLLKHAGYSYGPGQTPIEGRRATAKDLAKAERLAERFGLTFQWEHDPGAEPLDSWDDDVEHVAESCVCFAPDGRPLASLCGIWDADDTYRRVVEAELASEALAGVPHA